jgi:hypothetical protein
MASHCGGLSLNPGQVMSDLWWADFLRLLLVPLPITALHIIIIIIIIIITRQILADVPSGLSLTPSQETKKERSQFISLNSLSLEWGLTQVMCKPTAYTDTNRRV